ncbi:hypothetical protein GA565_17585 [Rouxiella sp. S1S-2]|uniref:Ig-like domain-containing protein n=1 Tax=Rouxiella sp. S1S-2 TaxID=2653856 RepID=UPI001264B47C|nr:Ig-like domain-containing protein [Rouxiella sp. S1S-2]KAB7897650.1 hypothetical protein GA565_17585 [Rouxiella sp. S1S-2]
MYTLTLSLSTNNQIVGKIADVVEAKVVDDAGAAVSGQVVKFSADNNAYFLGNTVTTGSNGTNTISVFSHTVGNSTVTAKLVDGTSATVVVTFIADPGLPPVTTPVGALTLTLDVSTNNQIVGNIADVVEAKVIDSTGAAIAKQSVSFSVDNGAYFLDGNKAITGSNGTANILIYSNTVGDSTVSATLTDGTSASTVVSFVADTGTPPVVNPTGKMTLTLDASVNNQIVSSAPDVVEAKVIDETGTAIAEQAVNFSVDNGAYFIDSNKMKTQSNGTTSIAVFSDTAGDATVNATLADGTAATLVISFVASDGDPGTGAELAAFKADVSAFITYVQQALTSLEQNVGSALLQLSTSVTAEDVPSAWTQFDTNVQTFETYFQQGLVALGQNVDTAFLQLKQKYQ